MTQITTSGGMITFKDTATGLTKQIGQNRLWLMFKADTVNFLQVDIPTDGYDGTPFWACRASNLTINGQSYTIEQLKNGEGLGDLFSSMSFTIEIVDELPDVGDPSTIYLVENGNTGTYTEYLWLAQEQTYEELGSVADVDLGNYYNKSQVDQLLALKANISSLATVATSGSYNDLSDKPVIPTVPTNVSAFTNDAGYLTEHQSLDNYYNKTQTDNLLAGKQHTLTAGANITIENNVISATGSGEPADLTNYYTKTETNTLLNAKADSNSLATVATSGNYNDLTNKPTNVSSFVNDAGYLTQHQSLADVFGKVNYDSSTKRINFYGKDDTSMTTVLGYVDASSFVVDGMVEDVRIENGNLVIDFNTDSGITDISIPLTDIFDPSNYYTKSEVDTALAGKANSSSLSTVATSGSYNDLTDKPTIPSAQVNSDWNASSGVAQILNKPTIPDFDYYSETTTQSSKMGKIDTIENNVGAKVEVSNGIDLDVQGSIPGGAVYTSVALGGSSITTNVQGSGYNRAYLSVNPGYMDINFETDDYDTSGFRFGFDENGNMVITKDGDDRVAMVSELSGKQDTLTAGTGITITNNVISATAPSITVDSALSSTSTNPVENRAIYAVVGDIEAALQAINGTTNA